MSPRKGEAAPKRGTVKRTALCRWCDEVLYFYATGWTHDDGGGYCDEEVVKEVDRQRMQREATTRRAVLEGWI